MSAINWGDAPTWLGAVFAAAAAAAAVWTLKSQRDQIDEQRDFIAEQRALIAEQSSTLTLERAELLHTAEERRREQAESLAWTTEGWYLILTNHSGAPVTDLWFEFAGPRPYEAGRVVRGVPSNQYGLTVEPELQPLAVLGSGREWGCERPDPQSVDPVFVTFVDEGGVRWRLDEHGKLDEVQPTP
ncbi:hypothetical protein [Streptomyces sp. NPDC005046]